MTTKPPPSPENPLKRQGSLLRTVQAIAWALIGLRKGSEYQKDLQSLNPLHIIVVALSALLLFVVGLLAVVNLMV